MLSFPEGHKACYMCNYSMWLDISATSSFWLLFDVPLCAVPLFASPMSILGHLDNIQLAQLEMKLLGLYRKLRFLRVTQPLLNF